MDSAQLGRCSHPCVLAQLLGQLGGRTGYHREEALAEYFGALFTKTLIKKIITYKEKNRDVPGFIQC